MANNKKHSTKKYSEIAKQAIKTNISITYRMAKEGFLTTEKIEVEVWREQF
jgi:fumarate hydratase class II